MHFEALPAMVPPFVFTDYRQFQCLSRLCGQHTYTILLNSLGMLGWEGVGHWDGHGDRHRHGHGDKHGGGDGEEVGRPW